MEGERSSSNRKGFKKNIDGEEARRSRSSYTSIVRREKKETQFAKRRQAGSDIVSVEPLSPTPSKSRATPVELSRELVEELSQKLYSPDVNEVLEATRQFRRYLSIEKNPPIQQIIDAGITPRLVQFLTANDNERLQFEAAWALTNIASGSSEQTRIVIEHNAVPLFVELLRSPSPDVQEQAAWAIGNVAGDSVPCRDYVLGLNALPALMETFTDTTRLSSIRNATWTLSNLFRGKPPPDISIVQSALPLLARLIFSPDTETVTDACWALSYFSDGPDDRIQAVINASVPHRLVELLRQPSSSQTPALRTIGNIVTGNDEQTQFMVNLNVLPALLLMLDHPKKNIRKEACWSISNVTAGTEDQIQAVINAGIVPKLIELLSSSEFDIQKEATWAISNATTGGNAQQTFYLASSGAIPPLCNMMQVPDSKVVTVALEGIENMLKVAEAAGDSVMAQMIEVITACGGLMNIEELQSHENEAIYKRAVNVLERYFGHEEENEEGNDESGIPQAPSFFNGGLTPPQPPASFSGASRPFNF